MDHFLWSYKLFEKWADFLPDPLPRFFDVNDVRPATRNGQHPLPIRLLPIVRVVC